MTAPIAGNFPTPPKKRERIGKPLGKSDRLKKTGAILLLSLSSLQTVCSAFPAPSVMACPLTDAIATPLGDMTIIFGLE